MPGGAEGAHDEHQRQYRDQLGPGADVARPDDARQVERHGIQRDRVGQPVRPAQLRDDQLVLLRIPDPDYVLIFCAVAAPAGGESVVIDGYPLIDRLRVMDCRYG